MLESFVCTNATHIPQNIEYLKLVVYDSVFSLDKFLMSQLCAHTSSFVRYLLYYVL